MDEIIKAGRPFKFTDAAEVKREIQNYFDSRDPHITEQMIKVGSNKEGEFIYDRRQVMSEQKPYTITGLSRRLGVTRETLNKYLDINHYPDEMSMDGCQEIIDSIQDAYQRVEEYNEEQLFVGNANGVKFSLTNNFGWVDKVVNENRNRDITKDLDDLDDQKNEVANEAAKKLEDGQSPKE